MIGCWRQSRKRVTAKTKVTRRKGSREKRKVRKMNPEKDKASGIN